MLVRLIQTLAAVITCSLRGKPAHIDVESELLLDVEWLRLSPNEWLQLKKGDWVQTRQ